MDLTCRINLLGPVHKVARFATEHMLDFAAPLRLSAAQLFQPQADGEQMRLANRRFFTNLKSITRSSILQRMWDHRLSQVPNLRLILTGPRIGVMESSVRPLRS